MSSKIFVTILMVSVLHPAFGQTAERPLADIEAESNLEQSTFENSNVLGIFDRFGIATSHRENGTSNRPTVRLSDLVQPKSQISIWSREGFSKREEIAAIQPFQTPALLNPWIVKPEIESSLIMLDERGGPSCDPMVLATPDLNEDDGRVKSYFTADCRVNASGNDIDSNSWLLVITVYPPLPHDESSRDVPKSGNVVSFNEQNSDISLECVVGQWQAHAILTLNGDDSNALFDNSVYEDIESCPSPSEGEDN